MNIKVIVGTGNPEEQYSQTRHNIGFLMIDFIAKKYNAGDFKLEKKFKSEITKVKIGKKSIILVKPQTFVNNIGDAVRKIKNFYKMKPEQFLIIQDDLDIEFGKIKFSFNKKSGGHRGVESIINSIKSRGFYRLRIGLANNSLKKARKQKTLRQKKESVGNFVLSKFTPAEQKNISKLFKKAIETVISCYE